MTLTTGLIGFCFVWLIILSLLFIKMQKHYRGLIGSTRKKTLDGILDSIVAQDKQFATEISALRQDVLQLTTKATTYYQKVGYVRFNPFERMGGEQSFILSLLDGNNDGIVLNFLYTKEGVRVYLKQIKKGEADGHELSKEEKEAINKAQ
ncbi:hypothetical protein A3D80_04000 [Candidatus Roizmanbacteria bacterium RIFCSPHIGHO2_02_FULL_40_13b]|uniref:DUF4446 domain-containing protein n=1 Tax=Candidatus Roizmanbacteria bacterium RIFCSPHIGHO2_01_FULL_39_24 TaxID=1802032 RepID=A0A1F7GK06_9BACT|nr:MAG: hypothetical protein A2799_03590 [Candidatus Roizmanbacteria bacterium RIFCSPHIGHO2_01_FULL_39_24]OGK27955.1 MAG: hypothetical protein A3D80_04000 [Candidatus Roizmanbacteria bacterium RIFCSPHIGHO2_02_FULL_40_13b]OGK49425.1 MAG: hypothetical protein A3A56_03185 [Candidatus Roizmanbacteria bacterium RIFCSPLOWO2_01_FULL_40_32]OGK56362.1 MAG: hypothetical protein A3H83_02535 [Candidatus Roizmanbacteria bacterium RIFCSPLOWO2_02_FULL_39_8]